MRLTNPIRLTDDLAYDPNIAEKLGEEDLALIAGEVFDGYEKDQQSRSTWLSRSRAAMELAMQIKPGKSFPWPNASNVAFPLLTIAALQFHSRAYPALFAGPRMAKYKVSGPDAGGQLTKSADLVGRYMSYQVLEEDTAFEEQHDRLFIYAPIVGCGFIKTRHSGALGHNLSEFVTAEDLVIDYYAPSVDRAHRKTQHVWLYRNEVHERCVSGTFLDILEEPWYTNTATPTQPTGEADRDRVTGLTQPQGTGDAALLFLEQHTWMDLDGDGYAEPYIVTLAYESREVVRIVARWERPQDVQRIGKRVVRITATEYFTKFGLIPSPDGGIYDMGFGALLGPLNESVDTLVNQLIDGGSMSVAAGGFLSRGVKLRGGVMTFAPFQWNQVEATGDDLRKGIFPLPVREPPAVLFNLLTLLINYTQRISGSTDVMVGENPGQNTAIPNMQAMLEQGSKIYAATFKRMWRALKEELHKLFILNGRHLADRIPFGSEVIGREMFLGPPSSLRPAADPTMTSDAMQLQQAMLIKQNASMTPGYDVAAVERNLLTAMHVDNADSLYPGPDKVPQGEDPKLALEKLRMQVKAAEMEQAKMTFIIEMQETARLNTAKILQLEAAAAKLLAEAGGAQAGAEIQAFQAEVAAFKAQSDAMNKRLELMQRGMSDGGEQGGTGPVAPESSDPGLPGEVGPDAAGVDGGMGSGSVPEPGTELLGGGEGLPPGASEQPV